MVKRKSDHSRAESRKQPRNEIERPDDTTSQFDPDFEFDEADDPYEAQPDSSGTIGGHRGAQEYGIVSEQVREAAHEVHRSGGIVRTEPGNGDEVKLTEDPIPFGEGDEDFAGASEYSTGRSVTERASRELTSDKSTVLPRDPLNRSDEEISDEIRRAIAAHERVEKSSSITVTVDSNAVHLEGRVRTVRTRLLVEELAEAIAIDREVSNRLRVE